MKKIMFNDRYGLTKAVIESRKTQTRRVFHADMKNPIVYRLKEKDGVRIVMAEDNHTPVLSAYKIGEIVAVAQSYKDIQAYVSETVGVDLGIREELRQSKGYSNKMFVRAELMSYQILITGIRLERLQDISDEDCLKEGIEQVYFEKGTTFGFKSPQFHIPNFNKHFEDFYNTPRKAYASLIDKISGKGMWNSNPYVFAYEFELVKYPNVK
jgi:hypothetical protein